MIQTVAIAGFISGKTTLNNLWTKFAPSMVAASDGPIIMSGKFEEMINNAKITELLNKKKAEEENKSFVLWILAIIGAVAAVAAIAFAVYRYMNPKYADFDGDFDYDEFEDDFEDDDIDDNDVYVKKTN